jgi:RNA polymerase sigma factor (sigma-70 family)
MSALDHPQEEPTVEQFLEQVRPRLRTLFARYRIPPQDTEDILQQALLALVYQWQNVRNKCLLYWRDRRRKLYDTVDAQVLEWMAGAMSPAQEDADLERDISTVIGRLPDRCRTLLRLRYRLGYDSVEVARFLGYSPSSISKVTTRCLSALMRHLTAAGLRKRG